VGPSPLAVSTAAFREQMTWLRSYAAVVPLDRLLANDWPASPSGLVCSITFDDGYASVYRHGYPVLSELNLPATVYLVADAIGDGTPKSSNDFNGLYPDEDMLRQNEVRELKAHGIHMGSHMMRHKDLTSLAPSAATEELRQSKLMIEQMTGSECSSFCFPWGKHNDSAVEAVRREGYKNAVITVQGRWRKNDAVDLYRVPRADVRRDYTLQDFQAVVRGDWDYLGNIQRLRRLMS
jgi:peptidoglycan/xylan/chitin deacetylase (PgdA/CDA1 family)